MLLKKKTKKTPNQTKKTLSKTSLAVQMVIKKGKVIKHHSKKIQIPIGIIKPKLLLWPCVWVWINWSYGVNNTCRFIMLYFKNLYILFSIVIPVLWCFSRFLFILFTRKFRRFTYLRKLTVHGLSKEQYCSSTCQMPGVNKTRKLSVYQIYC